MDLACLQADQLLRQFEKLIHYTLVRAGVGQEEARYEDLAQELRCQLLLLAKRFTGEPLGVDRYRLPPSPSRPSTISSSISCARRPEGRF